MGDLAAGSGCAGLTFALSLLGILNDIVHIGLWHGAVLVVCSLAGQFAVSPLVRW